jgi:hypothetical protein
MTAAQRNGELVGYFAGEGAALRIEADEDRKDAGRLVGTANHIAHQPKLSEIDFDGIMVIWMDYPAGLERWTAEVMLYSNRLRRSPRGRLKSVAVQRMPV